MTPVVSALVPVYNGERWLSEAIESALAQTFTDFEVVVVDDGSTDGSASIVESFAERDPRVRLVRTAHAGVRAARGISLEEARAPFVAFLDADDTWVAHRLERELPHADERTLVFSDAYLALEDNPPHARYRNLCPVPDVAYPAAGLFPQLLRSCFIPMSTVLAPRGPLVDAGAFRHVHGVQTAAASDWEMWMLLALRGVRFHYVDEPLATYRRHSASITGDWLRVMEGGCLRPPAGGGAREGSSTGAQREEPQPAEARSRIPEAGMAEHRRGRCTLRQA